MIANVDQRALGAVRPMDPATGSAVTRPLNVRAEGARFIRNRSGLYVIRSAPGFREYTKTFRLGDATPAPAAELEITISDPMGHYLPRRVAIQLPRDPDPAAADAPGSLFRPVDVQLLPASSAPTRANWSLIRASVFLPPLSPASGQVETPASGALLRVLAVPGGERLSRGCSDPRGEALVITPGVPITTFSDNDAEPVVLSEVPVQLEARYDPAASWPVDPDVLEESVAPSLITKTIDVHLRTGRMESMKITLETT